MLILQLFMKMNLLVNDNTNANFLIIYFLQDLRIRFQ